MQTMFWGIHTAAFINITKNDDVGTNKEHSIQEDHNANHALRHPYCYVCKLENKSTKTGENVTKGMTFACSEKDMITCI